MLIEIISTLVPKNGSPFATHDAQYGKGGWHSVATTVARDAIPVKRRVAGMAVHVTENSTSYKLDADLTTWSPLVAGGNFPPATEITLGGVIVGAGLQITEEGLLSVSTSANPYISVQAQESAAPAEAANGSIAIGGDTDTNTSLDSIAIGSGAITDADVSIAIGQASVATGDNSTAIGGSASAAGPDSVALGANSVTLLAEDFVVSVGNDVQRRRIIHVAEGVDQNDVVNVGQLAQAIEDVTYSLPAASELTLGGIKLGSGLTIDVDGVVSVDDLQPATLDTLGGVIVGSNIQVEVDGTISVPTATSLIQGVVRAGTGTHMEVDGILALDVATDTDLGGIIVGTGLTVDEDGILTADVLSVNDKVGAIVFVAGSNIEIDDSGDSIVINATGDANPIQTINSADGPGAVSVVQDPGSGSAAELRALVAGTSVTLDLDDTLGLITINATLSGTVTSVNNVEPVDGNVELSASDVGALATTGGSLTGELDMGGNRITNAGDPVDLQDVVTNAFLDTLILDAGVYA